MGLLGPVSQIAPVDASVMQVVLLIGMAVGVDYWLFYVKRAREERAAGRSNEAAIEAAAATSGRAVLISGFTVIIAMAGMYLGGISTFASFATGTIMVVAVALIGSLTVLPALLSKLGDRVDKGHPAGRPDQEPGRRGGDLVARPRPRAASSAGLGPRRGRDARGAGAADVGMQTSLGGIDETSAELRRCRRTTGSRSVPEWSSAEIVVVKADDVPRPRWPGRSSRSRASPARLRHFRGDGRSRSAGQHRRDRLAPAHRDRHERLANGASTPSAASSSPRRSAGRRRRCVRRRAPPQPATSTTR